MLAFRDQTGASLNIRVRSKAQKKPPLPGTAKHIFKKIGSLYDDKKGLSRGRERTATLLLDPAEKRRIEL